MRTHTRETQNGVSPDQALQFLKEGNERFMQNLKANRNLLQQVNETAAGQFPFAAILSCMDSRTSAELIFDQGLGDIFSIRVAGNVLNEDILGSMEYACAVAGSKLVLVLGHSKCGAIAGACDHVELGNLTGLLHKVQPALDLETQTTENRNSGNPDFVKNVTELNVKLTLERVRQESTLLADLEAKGQIKLVGGVYCVDSGRVSFFDEQADSGIPDDSNPYKAQSPLLEKA
ncbi:MAG: carbonic anhydrase family protein [Adhaeribacter sp.]